jgi:hypothetical protein
VRRWPALLAALLAPACSVLSLELGEAVPDERAASFADGSTRRAEVLALLGPPTQVAAHGDGSALLYEHVRLEEAQFGPRLEFLESFLTIHWLSWIKLSIGRSAAHHDVLVFLFDREGVLRGRAAGEWEQVFGSGTSMQVLLTVEQVVDPGNLRDEPLPLRWGSELLLPLPVVLNLPHRADLVLRGTGAKAGQAALEAVPYGGGR